MDEPTVADDFAALACAALKVSHQLLEAIPPSGRQAVDAALRGGCKVELVFGPIPAFERAELVLVEAEGRRHRLGNISLNPAPSR